MSSSRQVVVSLDCCRLQLRPAALNSQYWHWRAERDVIKLDFAYAVMTLCRVLACTCAWASTHPPLWCVLLLLVASCQQLFMILWRRQTYPKYRLAMVCLLHVSWTCFSWHALKGSHSRSTFPPGQAEASWLLHLAVNPMLQPMPFLLQLPLQCLELGVLLHNFQRSAVQQLEALPAVAAVLHRLHAVCEGIFHVGAGFVFVMPEALSGCGTGDIRLAVNFLVAYVGFVLPLFFTYKSELLGKARFVLSLNNAEPDNQNSSSTTTTTSSSNSSAALTAGTGASAAPTTDSSPAAWLAVNRDRLQLVGLLKPIHKEWLMKMLACSRFRLKDDVICSLLLLIVTWGLCSWATPKGT